LFELQHEDAEAVTAHLVWDVSKINSRLLNRHASLPELPSTAESPDFFSILLNNLRSSGLPSITSIFCLCHLAFSHRRVINWFFRISRD
jgi:hypothetical protein